MPGLKPITQCTAAEWKDIVQHTRAVCPPPKGWKYRFIWSAALRKTDAAATCHVDAEKKVITVKVAKGYCEAYTRELMVHEMAHALAWQHSPHVFASDHDETWAQAVQHLRTALVAAKYAKIYDAMHTDRA